MNKTILLSITAIFCYIVFRPGHDPTAAQSFTPSTFQRAIESGKPVVVDFRAKWYAPSRALAPQIDRLSRESFDFYLVGKVDVDEHKSLTNRYRVRRYPTVLIFKDGKVVHELDTTMSVEEMQSKVYEYL